MNEAYINIGALTDGPSANSGVWDLGAMQSEPSENIIEDSAGHTISWEEDTDAYSLSPSVSQEIDWDQLADGLVEEPEILESVEQTIDWEETLGAVYPYYLDSSHTIGFIQTVQAANITKHASYLQELNFIESAAILYDATVEQTIEWVEDAYRSIFEVDNIGWVETIEVYKAADMGHFIQFQHLATYGRDASLKPNQSLGLVQAAAYLLIKSCTDREFAPATDSTSPLAGLEPPVLIKTNLVLEHPYTSPDKAIELKAPSFDDRDVFGFNRVNRVSRGGDLQIFGDPSWPTENKLMIQIDAVSHQSVQDFLWFHGQSLGQEIHLRDWEGRDWRGIIVGEPQIVHANKNDRSISFEFEGELVEA